MSIGFVFWLLMLLWFLNWFVGMWNAQPWQPIAGNVLLFILFFLLGWHAFGFAIHA
jgi:hypothetical protein